MPEAQPLGPGDPVGLGPYKILGRLGEGGQGVVFIGRAPHSAHVAIKLLHARLSNDSTARARFVRELDVAKQVARFCTAQVLDADVAGDRPYIVSEYVEGRSLHSLVTAEGPRTGGALERLAIGTLTALTAIHQAGIVHRDFKPHNVMLGPDGPRVIDFGVARALGAAGDTQDIGTPAYMAPEQLTSAGPSPATDMFAWGATMLFAATGRPPFGNDDVAAVMHRILHAEADAGPLPSPLREVVTACLAKDPARRPTARDAQQRLLGTETPFGADPFAAGDLFAAASSSMGPAGLADPPAPAEAPAEALAEPVPATSGPMPATPGPVPATPGSVPATPGSVPTEPPGSVHAAPESHLPADADSRPTQGRPQATVPGPPPEPRRRPRWPLPVAAGVLVAALVLAVPLWAATRNDGNGGGGQARQSQAAGGPGAPQPPGATLGGAGAITPSGSASPTGRASGAATARGRSSGPSSTSAASSAPAPAPQAPAPSGTTTSAKRNPYTAAQVCDSGGHGGGYYVQRSSSFTGGATYQLYNSSGYNCVVTLKTANVGQKTKTWAQLKRQSDGKSVSDSGSYAYYAGPVFLSAKGTCVAYSGGTGSGSTSASWANCG